MGWGGVRRCARQTSGAACEQIKVMKAKMSPGKHLAAEPRPFNERAGDVTRKRKGESKQSAVDGRAGRRVSGRMDGRTDGGMGGLGVQEGRM